MNPSTLQRLAMQAHNGDAEAGAAVLVAAMRKGDERLAESMRRLGYLRERRHLPTALMRDDIALFLYLGWQGEDDVYWDADGEDFWFVLPTGRVEQESVYTVHGNPELAHLVERAEILGDSQIMFDWLSEVPDAYDVMSSWYGGMGSSAYVLVGNATASRSDISGAIWEVWRDVRPYFAGEAEWPYEEAEFHNTELVLEALSYLIGEPPPWADEEE